jgi:hypothetical protein
MRRKIKGRNDREAERYKALKSLLHKKASNKGKSYTKEEVDKILAKKGRKYKQTSVELALELGRTQVSIQQVRRRYAKTKQ